MKRLPAPDKASLEASMLQLELAFKQRMHELLTVRSSLPRAASPDQRRAQGSVPDDTSE